MRHRLTDPVRATLNDSALGAVSVAAHRIDERLLAMAEAAEQFGGNGVFEWVTNTPAAARFFESPMSALGPRGYVRIVP
ncbi:hypothetical protein J1G44_07615 [Cellulomonas sp. zg-ZUI199]|uniref:Uncharacterized protein n=1 Tax=Cellulomonas wangleii TaxID=2816956 RepID=A0ABX8D4G5_9CELL|nr:hypothetical protein [Cellulomonas wangleii]MBO0924351.1 hypothetical protein [Cellulomonas wangleii]QVI62353.1 hypothetical protein KG103_18460 [Cellulomonas wangleii]